MCSALAEIGHVFINRNALSWPQCTNTQPRYKVVNVLAMTYIFRSGAATLMARHVAPAEREDAISRASRLALPSFADSHRQQKSQPMSVGFLSSVQHPETIQCEAGVEN